MPAYKVYDVPMRYLLLSILVLFVTQPLQASYCDMSADQSNSHQTMHDSDMHAGMDHDSDNHKMDCCDDEPESSEHDCTVMTHCGTCPAGLVAVNLATSSPWLVASNGNMPTLSQVPPNEFNSPPFRPPIF